MSTEHTTLAQVRAEGEAAADTALARHPQAQRLQYALERAIPMIARVLPRGMSAERQMQLALNLAGRNPKILECTPISLVRAVVAASELGLELGESRQEAHLIPFRDRKSGGMEAKLIIGWQGLIKLGRNSGAINAIEARAVRSRDVFALTFGAGSGYTHTPYLGHDASDDAANPIVGFYCSALLTSGHSLVEHMTRAQVDAVRDGSDGYRSARQYGREHPWATSYEAMGRKTVVRAAAKYWPRSDQLLRALEADDDVEHEARRALAPVPGDVVRAQLAERAATARAVVDAEEVSDG